MPELVIGRQRAAFPTSRDRTTVFECRLKPIARQGVDLIDGKRDKYQQHHVGAEMMLASPTVASFLFDQRNPAGVAMRCVEMRVVTPAIAGHGVDGVIPIADLDRLFKVRGMAFVLHGQDEALTVLAQ